MLRPVLVALVLACSVGPAAQAATVDVSSGRLRFTAGPGEANSVSVYLAFSCGPNISPCLVISDSRALLDTSTCTRDSANRVHCHGGGVMSYGLVLGDGDDNAIVNLTLPGTIDGGAGNDGPAGGTGAEELVGGPGIDWAQWSGGRPIRR